MESSSNRAGGVGQVPSSQNLDAKGTATALNPWALGATKVTKEYADNGLPPASKATSPSPRGMAPVQDFMAEQMNEALNRTNDIFKKPLGGKFRGSKPKLAVNVSHTIQDGVLKSRPSPHLNPVLGDTATIVDIERFSLKQLYNQLTLSLQQVDPLTLKINYEKQALITELADLKKIIDADPDGSDQPGVAWNRQIEKSPELKAFVKNLGLKVTSLKCQNAWNRSTGFGASVINAARRLVDAIVEKWNSLANSVWRSYARVEAFEKKKKEGRDKALGSLYKGAAETAAALAMGLKSQEVPSGPTLTVRGGAAKALGAHLKANDSRKTDVEPQTVVGNLIEEIKKAVLTQSLRYTSSSPWLVNRVKAVLNVFEMPLTAGLQKDPETAVDLTKDFAAPLARFTDPEIVAIRESVLQLGELIQVYANPKLAQRLVSAVQNQKSEEYADVQLSEMTAELQARTSMLEQIEKQAKGIINNPQFDTSATGDLSADTKKMERLIADIKKNADTVIHEYLSEQFASMSSPQIARLERGNEEHMLELISGAAQASRQPSAEIVDLVRAQVSVEVGRAIGGSVIKDAMSATPQQVEKAKAALIEKFIAEYMESHEGEEITDSTSAEFPQKAQTKLTELNDMETFTQRAHFVDAIRLHQLPNPDQALSITTELIKKLNDQLFIIKAQMPPNEADDDALDAHNIMIQTEVLVLCAYNLAEIEKQLGWEVGASRLENRPGGDRPIGSH